jgi:hypothetical protein
VELHPKLMQNVREGRLRRHAEPGREKLLEHHILVVCKLWNNLLPKLPCVALDEIVQ